MYKKFETIESNIFSSNPYWQYMIEKYRMPSGNIGDYHFVRTLGSTMIIPIFNKKIILTKQYRYLNKKFSLEFPGGGLELGLLPSENAKKEMIEETGFTSTNIIKIGEFNPYNGVTDEICNVYIAYDLSFIGDKQEESEEIEVIELTLDEFLSKIQINEIWDGMTMASFLLFQNSKFYKELL